MRLTTSLSHWLLGALLLLSLAACGSFPAIGLPSQQQAAAPPAAAQLLGKAQEAEARGDFVGATQVYLQLVEASRASARQDYQLSAAAAALRAGNISQARGLVNAVESGGLDAKLSARRQLLDGEIALSEGNPQQALDALAKVTNTNLTPSVQAQAHLLRAEAFSVMGNQLESARERVLLEPLLTDPIAVRDNQNAIVQALSGLSDQVLQQLGATPPDVLSGWMELVLIARTTPDPGQYNERVIDWRHRYRQHPATQDL
ncbi:MAG TPA: penicillin-binding protein activator, partial [Gammaproteobacteria bacterium]|nr:penicillin-binding protein activator [Gammaproteobacteria bacterium]